MALLSIVVAGIVGFGIALGVGLLLLALAPLVVELATRKRYPVVTPGGAVLITGSSTGGFTRPTGISHNLFLLSLNPHTHPHTRKSYKHPPGIGRHAALYLADHGGFLVFAGVRRPQDGEALRAQAADPQRVVPVILDVTKPVRGWGAYFSYRIHSRPFNFT